MPWLWAAPGALGQFLKMLKTCPPERAALSHSNLVFFQLQPPNELYTKQNFHGKPFLRRQQRLGTAMPTVPHEQPRAAWAAIHRLQSPAAPRDTAVGHSHSISPEITSRWRKYKKFSFMTQMQSANWQDHSWHCPGEQQPAPGHSPLPPALKQE